MPQVDVLIVGSGPAGAQAAAAAVDLGLRVVTVDVGELDTSVGDLIPEGSFTHLRRTDPEQRRYLVGEIDEDSVVDIRVGAQLTPPRRYLTRRIEELAPLDSQTFHPMQSLAKGGLGGGWGAGCETFTPSECARAGIDHARISARYGDVAADIGISGAASDDIAANMSQLRPLQRPADIDDNAASILATYRRRAEKVKARGFELGRPPIALLTERIERDGYVREPNPLTDMDFYRDAERSVYRPRFTIERLETRPGYSYESGLLALRFDQDDDENVRLTCLDIATGGYRVLKARRLILAAGALNSARIVARSFDAYGRRMPLICNPYRYVPAVNLPMLGRSAGDRRHSMAQLAGALASGPDDAEQMFIGFYSYRSLLLHKLVKEMPLPAGVGLLAARVLMSSLTVLGAHFSDSPAGEKWIALEAAAQPQRDVLRAKFELTQAEHRKIKTGMLKLLGVMLELRLVPLGIIDSGFGASIHYAGPLSSRDSLNPLATRPDGSLFHASSVSIGDSAAWSFLPAKGPTLTIMAHAREVANTVAGGLGVGNSL